MTYGDQMMNKSVLYLSRAGEVGASTQILKELKACLSWNQEPRQHTVAGTSSDGATTCLWKRYLIHCRVLHA